MYHCVRPHRCTYCDRNAIVNIPERKLRLCSEHFVQFFETEVEKTVEQYGMLSRVRRLLVAVSGGKDSIALLYVLRKIADRKRIELVGVTIDLGIAGYSEYCVEIARRHFEKLGIAYRIVRLEDYGFTIDSARKCERELKRPVCSVCGVVKRYILNKVAVDLKCDAIATGHNLVDMCQYLLANILSGSLGGLTKMSPVVKSEEEALVTRIRPLFFMHERYIELYVKVLGLDYVRERCPYSMRGLRERNIPFQEYLRMVLLDLDLRYPGTLYRMLYNFCKTMLPILIQAVSSTQQEIISKCKLCGMPTSSRDEICAFCKIRSVLSRGRPKCH